MKTYYIVAFFLPFILSYVLTPVAKKLAYKVGAIDVPKDNRRVHKKPIPRLGGLAIFLSTAISMIILMPKNNISISILIGGSLIAITGIIDDIKPMSAKLKLALQIVAALIVVLGGVQIDTITNPSNKQIIELKAFAIPITIFWIVGITNTLNLIDGLDGLSAGVSGISASSFFIVASIMSAKLGNPDFMIIPILLSAILAGAAFGFLPHNFNPAKIFMGDTGSLFLGFMLSVIAVEGVMKGVATIAIVIPILILGLPIFDTTFAILRRFINKRPIMEADKGHLHHRLLDKGLSQRQTVLVLYTISVLMSVSAISFSNLSFGIGIVGSLLVSTILFNAVSTNQSSRVVEIKKREEDR